MGRSCHLCCLRSKLKFFKRSRVYCSKSTHAHQTNQKKACIRSFDTNNSIQSLASMYNHAVTERIYRLHGVKISWTPTLGRFSNQFGLFNFSMKVPMFFWLFAKTTCPKWQQIVSQLYCKNELSYEVSFLLVLRNQ